MGLALAATKPAMNRRNLALAKEFGSLIVEDLLGQDTIQIANILEAGGSNM